MKIIGIGVDIVKNKRISLAVKKKSFINRIFGKNEISMSKKVDNRINYFSKRFAAKEALAKALGTGFRDGLNFKDIEIINNKQGMPYYIISPKINNLIKKKKKVKNFNLFLSISDEKEYSIAFTIIQTKS
jgi:holo-[acyl-carrier protein] synthase